MTWFSGGYILNYHLCGPIETIIPMKLKNIFPFLFGVFFVANVTAQSIAAPELICIRNDSLFWNNITSNCGNYLQTLVFMANVEAGPYTEIGQINDPNQTAFNDPNPGAELRYYYLSYRYDCPGITAENSDTLNNLIPLPPSSVWVSVVDDNVVVNWTQSNSPQAAGYRIFRRDPQGLVSIATVNGGTTLTYTDASFATQPESVAYAVATIDACGNQSLLSSQATAREATSPTLELSGGNGCTAIVTATTDGGAVSSVPLPINGWDMYVSTDGGPFVQSGSFGAGNSFTYTQANNDASICIYLEGSVQGQIGRPVRTPVKCIDVSIVPPVRPMRLLGGGYNDAGDFCFDVEWDRDAAVSLLQLNFLDAGSQVMSSSLEFDGLNGPVTSLCQERASLPDLPFSLNLRIEDSCGNVVITNQLNPTFLSGEVAESGVNELSWTAFDSELDGSVTYRLERLERGGNISTVYTGPDLNFRDIVGVTDANLALSCYKVYATIRYDSDGTTETYNSQTVCLEQLPMVYMPNAFSPTATMIINREFCPGFARRPTGLYQLDIWDRWGGHVFSTTDPDDCWEGDYRGKPAEPGVYLYVLKLELGSRIIERKGSVNLFR